MLVVWLKKLPVTRIIQEGFLQDNKYHNHVFFDPNTHEVEGERGAEVGKGGSLNTYIYSPIPLKGYLDFVKQISDEYDGKKPIIISVAGSAEDVVKCYRQIILTQKNVKMSLAMEINLSCPNLPNKPPPAYDAVALGDYLSALGAEQLRFAQEELGLDFERGSSVNRKGEDGARVRNAMVAIGIKIAPFTYADQFTALVGALCGSQSHTGACPISFVTATNTLGNSLVLVEPSEKDVFVPACLSHDFAGIGGMAGTPLHPLALGNVFQLSKQLAEHRCTQHVHIIGVGGVSDGKGYRRMRKVGATAVGVGTALGRKGVGIFAQIANELDGKWY